MPFWRFHVIDLIDCGWETLQLLKCKCVVYTYLKTYTLYIYIRRKLSLNYLYTVKSKNNTMIYEVIVNSFFTVVFTTNIGT